MNLQRWSSHYGQGCVLVLFVASMSSRMCLLLDFIIVSCSLQNDDWLLVRIDWQTEKTQRQREDNANLWKSARLDAFMRRQKRLTFDDGEPGALVADSTRVSRHARVASRVARVHVLQRQHSGWTVRPVIMLHTAQQTSNMVWDRRSWDKTGLRPRKIGLSLGIAGRVLCCKTRSWHTRRRNDLEGRSNFSSGVYLLTT